MTQVSDPLRGFSYSIGRWSASILVVSVPSGQRKHSTKISLTSDLQILTVSDMKEEKYLTQIKKSGTHATAHKCKHHCQWALLQSQSNHCSTLYTPGILCVLAFDQRRTHSTFASTLSPLESTMVGSSPL